MSRISIHAEGDNHELELFRRQWQQEIQQNKSGGSSSEEARAQGHDLYKRASKAESLGDLPKAVRLYRQAFKLCPELDTLHYANSNQKNKPNTLPEKASDNVKKKEDLDFDTLPQYEEDEVLLSQDVFFQPNNPTKSIHLSKIPHEILLNIFLEFDAKTLERCGRVCKGWLNLSRHPKLWRGLCLQTWGNMALLNTLFREYKSWRKIFIERPRLRYDGIYISKNKYLRKGENEGLYYQTLHEVVYYRYLLFFSNGQCYAATSFDKPREFVPLFQTVLSEGLNESKQIKDKIIKGCYEVDDAAGNLKVYMKSSDNLNLTLSLEMKTSNRGTHQWLRVLQYTYRKEHQTEENPYNILIDRYVFTTIPTNLLPSFHKQ